MYRKMESSERNMDKCNWVSVWLARKIIETSWDMVVEWRSVISHWNECSHHRWGWKFFIMLLLTLYNLEIVELIDFSNDVQSCTLCSSWVFCRFDTFAVYYLLSAILLVVGVLPLPRTRQRCAAGSLLHPAYIRDSATQLLQAESSTELTTQLSNALSHTAAPCDL